MDELDKGIKRLEIEMALSTQCHIEYLKSKGKRSSCIWPVFQEWEAKEILSSKNELSTPTTMLVEAFMLELVAKELKQEVTRLANKKEES